MTEHFRKNFDFFQGNYVDYFKLFKIDKFKRYVYFFYLEQYKDKINIEAVIQGNNIEISKSLIELRSHGNMAYTFIYLFYEFDRLVEELVQYLSKLLHKMKLFHIRKKRLYQVAVDKFCNSENLNIYKKSCNVKDEVKLPKQVYSVCFMQQFIVLYHCTNDGLEYAFIIGFNSDKVMTKYINYSYITHITAARIFANEIMNDIIRELRKEELTITKLSMKLNVSRATMDRMMGILYDELAIHISKTSGNEKYYKINPEYFLAAKVVLCQEIDEILLDFKQI